MEDRTLPVLHLETSPEAVDVVGATRAADLANCDGVGRVSWWENVRPGRDDLPRELLEFTTLLCCEADVGFVAPLAHEDVTVHRFVRTGRPGQGRLTGGRTTGLSLVLISPRNPADARELRDWADFVHIRQIAEASVPGYSMITPYERTGGGDPLFCHLYEIDLSELEHDDPEIVFQSMTPLVTRHIGGPETPAWKEWALHPALRIMYVNTFRKVGELSP